MKSGLRGNIRVLIADHHDLFRVGMRAKLESQGDWEVLEAGNGTEAVEQAKRFRPDIAVLGMQMSGLDGVESAAQLGMLLPKIKILLIGLDESKRALSRALAVGARAYLTKSTAARDLADTVADLAEDRSFSDPESKLARLA